MGAHRRPGVRLAAERLGRFLQGLRGRRASLLAGALAVSLAMLAVPAAGRAEGQPSSGTLQVGGLTTEHRHDPLGIDVGAPRFGWTLSSTRDGASQSAYRIVVSSTPGGPADVWDSGKVSSPRSFDVPYGGPALHSRTRYFWRVRVWDGAGNASPWSNAAWFETAFMSPGDFKGDWIGAHHTLSLAGAHWIWYPEGDPATQAPAGTRYFRRSFDLPQGEKISYAKLLLTADDGFTLYVNGEKLAQSPQVYESWKQAMLVDLRSALRPGRNVIAIAATNSSASPAGLIARLHVEGSAGAPVDLVTDGSWRTSSVGPSGWEQPGYDDSSWQKALDVAPYGGGPWDSQVVEPGTVSLQGATWIWYPEGDPTQSAPAATRYFRRTFDVPDHTVDQAKLLLTADDQFVLYVNGEQVARSSGQPDAWRQAVEVDLSKDLRPGAANTIAVAATNAGGPAGLIGKLKIDFADGSSSQLVTDGQWKASTDGPQGWEQPGFDDSSWVAAKELAPYGQGPWDSGVVAPGPPEPLLRKSFTVDKTIASARAYVSGLGYYKLYLNGKRIGDRELDPAFTVYDKTVLYSAYDVTDALRSGDNALGVSLGRGYYGMLAPGGFSPGPSAPWHSDPKLKLELDITYDDGSTRRIVSDGSWRVADGPVLSDSVMTGETYDARREQPGWTSPGFDDSGWRQAALVTAPAGTLHAEALPPIKVRGSLPVTGVSSPKDGVKVYDFGTTTAGWAKVTLSGPRGAAVTIKYGEKLHPDGTVDNAGLQSYTYILKGADSETYAPSYSYDGYRYVEVDAPSGVTVSSVEGKRVYTAVASTGGFTSSSTLLDSYQQAEADTILNNLHSIPTDTPMYEKRGWTADGHLYADAAIANFGMENFYENWMRDHRDDQHADGTINVFVPSGGALTVDPVWSASYVLIDWDLYWYYGDTRVLRHNYAGMKKWLGYFENQIAKSGYIYTGFSFGDWVAPGYAFAPEGTRLVGTAYIYKTATTMARIARVLGRSDDADHFDSLAAKVRTAFNATFLDRTAEAYYDNRSAGYRQTSNLLPLSLGIVPDADRQAVLANLVDDIRSRGDHLNTGCLGTKVILPVLTDTGHAELAYKVATNPTYPGWGYWFTHLGATTMWEQWEASARSHDHAFLGTVDDWLYQRVAGIEPEAPGYRRIRIQPYPVGDLSHAAAHVSSPLGEVSSSWVRGDGSFTLRASVPVGASADILVPAADRDAVDAPADATFEGMQGGYAEFRVGSGAYRFDSTT